MVLLKLLILLTACTISESAQENYLNIEGIGTCTRTDADGNTIMKKLGYKCDSPASKAKLNKANTAEVEKLSNIIRPGRISDQLRKEILKIFDILEKQRYEWSVGSRVRVRGATVKASQNDPFKGGKEIQAKKGYGKKRKYQVEGEWYEKKRAHIHRSKTRILRKNR